MNISSITFALTELDQTDALWKWANTAEYFYLDEYRPNGLVMIARTIFVKPPDAGNEGYVLGLI